MVRMSKAVARRRLMEARQKLIRVFNECFELSPTDNGKLYKMSHDLTIIIKKLK